MTTFAPPAPGAWELEQTHLTRPISVLMAEIFPDAMMSGFKDGSRTFGVLLDHLEIAIINRFAYMAPRPVGAPKGAKGAPPRPVFALMRRLHPEIRRRVRRADVVFRERYWRKEAEWWHGEVKPSIAVEARSFLAEDVDAISAEALAAHVRRAVDFARQTTYWHHRFNMCALLPVGDLLVHTMQWTGLSAGDILQAMRGLSPVSAGAVEEIAALRAAILADGSAMTQLLGNEPAEAVLEGLLARPAPLGPAMRRYLDTVGLRILGGYDVADRHAREHPDLLVKIIRGAVTTDDASRRAAAEQAVQEIRGRVPAGHRAEFDALLAEARIVYGIRDERIFHGDGLGNGIARRAVLAAGRRLAAQGRIDEASHLVDASCDEIVMLLEGRGGPSASEIADRVRYRMETPIGSAPASLGFPPSPPPPAEWLPPSAARLQRIVDLVLQLMFQPREDRREGRALKGFGVSPGVYEGPARVIASIYELPEVQQGEVLIATSTGPTFNVVLPLIGALVTERGGALSHAAIVAREYGLPGVVGCPRATQQVRTGMRVRVDGGTGEVWTLE
ncbi:MAG TPA: PEP-utilizing enzyme [Gemmatimonadaceae bacterium]|nr:PEP-utilizing enzyme [Gemmatimonadaceae bacterium]